ncbi:unnamed protein product, partial [Mycena citricolor]
GQPTIIMHGVKRVRHSPEALAAKKAKEQDKIKDYLALTDEILGKRDAGDLSREAFDLTTRILQMNPEFYTVWNYRRNILLGNIFPSSTPVQTNDLLTEELSMTTVALKLHPKVYWIWNHRRWCLLNVPDGPNDHVNGWRQENWDKEMFVVNKMLDVDPRNFHAWSYRRHILANMPVARPDAEELAYTTHKIESNFSNFSAWHHRTKLLTSLWASGELNRVETKEEEYELVHNAMYTDPSDQSVWIYHRWLVGTDEDVPVLEREMSIIQELLDEQPDSKWCMESLVHYKRMLLLRDASRDVEATKDECRHLLQELKTLDPARRKRYEEMEQQL